MRRSFDRLLRALAVVCGVMLPAFALAQDTATAAQVGGTVSVQRADGAARLLAPGARVEPGDTLTTQADSFARLRFADGAELALRPNTVLRLDAYTFRKAEPAADTFAMTLLRGGLRTITGLVSRRGNPDAFRLNTTTATMGVRGTDFTARICQGDECTRDAQRPSPAGERAATPTIAARVALAQGRVSAIAQDGRSRPLAVGLPVFVNEIVDTGPGGQAVLVFADQGRVTVQENTRLLVERFRFDAARPGSGEMLLNLLRGGLRALTGSIARERADAFQLRTSVATVGVRGTGFDVLCDGACALDALFDPRLARLGGEGQKDLSTPVGHEGIKQTGAPVGHEGIKQIVPGGEGQKDRPASGLLVSVWNGQVVVVHPLGTALLETGQTVFAASGAEAPRRVDLPEFMQRNPAPRPDGLQIDLKELFGAPLAPESGPGLYVTVHDGEVVSSGEGFRQTIRTGEAFFVSPDGARFGRLPAPPVFFQRDPFIGTVNLAPASCVVR
jgi:hypothetical protein